MTLIDRGLLWACGAEGQESERAGFSPALSEKTYRKQQLFAHEGVDVGFVNHPHEAGVL
jgi:hypothetical protein